MKIIDLLNKIANGGKSIPINYDNNSKESLTYYLYDKCGEEYDDSNLQNILNYEVEILEEKKIPEKLESYISCGWNGTCKDLKRDELFENLKKIGNKINEIIDYLESDRL